MRAFRATLTFFCLALLAGCLGVEQGNDASLQSSAAIVVTPEHPNLGEQVTLGLSPPALLQRYDSVTWRAQSSVQGDPWTCQESLQSATLHCVPAAAGQLVVSCDITSRLGLRPIHLEKQIVVAGGTENNPVRLVVDLFKATETSAFAIRSTAAGLNSSSAIAVQNQPVKFDFRRSDRQDLNLLIDDGLSGVYLAADYVSTHTYATPGDYSIRIEARNQNNALVGRLNFVLSITCQNPNLTLDSSKLTITHDTGGNDDHFQLAIANGFATGGQGSLRMRVDFNGDGVTDLDWTPIAGGGFYSVDAGSPDIQNFHTRRLQIEVADSICNAHKSTGIDYDFPIPFADGVPSHDQQAQRPDVNFLQAKVIGSDLTDATINTGFNAAGNSSTASPPTGPTLRCDFNGYGSGNLPAYLQYPLGSTDVDGYWSDLHGFTSFSFYLPGYNIDVQDYNTTFYVRYETAYRPDSTHQRRHYLNSACPGKVSVKTTQSNFGDCTRNGSGATDGTQTVHVTFQLVGTFSCTATSQEDATSVQFRDGAFSCLVGGGNGINLNKACTSPPAASCGDGWTEAGEQCDSGAQNGHDHFCDNTCHFVSINCGDGFHQSGEACDYGSSQNGQPGIPCDTTCHPISTTGGAGGGYCGDGVKNGTEQCDGGFGPHGNGHAESQCNTDCTSILCGNTHTEPGEECDNGSHNGEPHNPCDATCHLRPM